MFTHTKAHLPVCVRSLWVQAGRGAAGSPVRHHPSLFVCLFFMPGSPVFASQSLYQLSSQPSWETFDTWKPKEGTKQSRGCGTQGRKALGRKAPHEERRYSRIITIRYTGPGGENIQTGTGEKGNLEWAMVRRSCNCSRVAIYNHLEGSFIGVGFIFWKKWNSKWKVRAWSGTF